MKRLFLLFIVLSLSISCDRTINPISGDIYLVKHENNSYTTWKITTTDKNMIWYIKNDYHVSEKSFIDSIEIPENYTDSPLSIKKDSFNKKQNIYLLKTQLK